MSAGVEVNNGQTTLISAALVVGGRQRHPYTPFCTMEVFCNDRIGTGRQILSETIIM